MTKDPQVLEELLVLLKRGDNSLTVAQKREFQEELEAFSRAHPDEVTKTLILFYKQSTSSGSLRGDPGTEFDQVFEFSVKHGIVSSEVVRGEERFSMTPFGKAFLQVLEYLQIRRRRAWTN